MGKQRSWGVRGPLGTGWFNSPCCHRDPARSLEQGPEGPETPIQVVLRWVRLARWCLREAGTDGDIGMDHPLPSDPRVRPMSAAELRRGEQSAVHCSGTRTLQVKNPPTPRT